MTDDYVAQLRAVLDTDMPPNWIYGRQEDGTLRKTSTDKLRAVLDELEQLRAGLTCRSCGASWRPTGPALCMNCATYAPPPLSVVAGHVPQQPEPCDGDCDCDCQLGQPCLCPEWDCYCGPCPVCDRNEGQQQPKAYTADPNQPEIRDQSAWCWNQHPDHPLPCGRLAGHDGQHARGERRWDSAQQPERGCRACGHAFDLADKRFDGNAEERDTGYCRGCIDNCHEGGVGHRCVICVPKEQR